MSQYKFLCSVLAIRGIQRDAALAAFAQACGANQEINCAGFMIFADGEQPGTHTNTLYLYEGEGPALVRIWENDRGEFGCGILDKWLFSSPVHRHPSLSMTRREKYGGVVYRAIYGEDINKPKTDLSIELWALLTCIANLAVLHAPDDSMWDGQGVDSDNGG